MNRIRLSIRSVLLFFMANVTFLLYAQESASRAILITNVNVWDGISDNLKEGYDVLVEGNIIKKVAPSIVTLRTTIIIDGKGGTLIPGLIDAHLHLMITEKRMGAVSNDYEWSYIGARATQNAKNLLFQGFTTVRDMGGPVMGLKKAIDEGIVPGPRIYPSGNPIFYPSGDGNTRNSDSIIAGCSVGLFATLGWFYAADGVHDVVKATRANLLHGATQITMMTSDGAIDKNDPLHTVQNTEEELRAAVQAAKDWGTYVAVHAFHPNSIARALEAGVISIEHGELLDEETMRMIRDKKAWLVPSGSKKEMDLAKKIGVRIPFGSDVFGQLGNETAALTVFASRLQWYKPVEVLRQSTSMNAKFLGLCGKLNPYPNGKIGVVEEGAYADILIYEGNPLKDLQVVVHFEENLRFIMKDGVIVKNEWSKIE